MHGSDVKSTLRIHISMRLFLFCLRNIILVLYRGIEINPDFKIRSLSCPVAQISARKALSTLYGD